MEKLKGLWAKQWVRYVVVAIVAMGIGGAVASPEPLPPPAPQVVTKTVEVEKKVEVEKTPASCIAALDADNKTFVVIGNGLSNLDFASIVDHINKVSGERNANQADCLSKR